MKNFQSIWKYIIITAIMKAKGRNTENGRLEMRQVERRKTLKFKESEAGDLALNFCGISETEPLHSYGPSVKPHYIIHYVLEGEGDYYVGENQYHLKAGQGFLIEPGVLVFYQADQKRPWKYIWAGFGGQKVKEILRTFGLSTDAPVFQSDQGEELKRLVLDMMEHRMLGYSHELRLTGLLYLFLSTIGKGRVETAGVQERENIYVKKAVEYIKGNYHMGIKVKDVAEYVCINRSYLYTLFEKQLGLSPQKYLTAFRMNKAAELLEVTQFPVSAVAMSCGYQDIVVFTKAFRQAMGMTPTQYRKRE